MQLFPSKQRREASRWKMHGLYNQLFATRLHHPQKATFKIWGKNGGTKTGSIGLGSKKDVVSLSLSFSLFRVQHVLKSKPLSGTWHQRSQHYMNHHEPSCSNLSWKKISLPVQCPALPPMVSMVPTRIWHGFGPFFMRQGTRKSIHRSFRERNCGCHFYHPSRRHRSLTSSPGSWGEQRRLQPTTGWWFWNPANSPVECGVGYPMKYLPFQKYIPGVFFSPGYFELSTIRRNDFRRHHSVESSNRTNGRQSDSQQNQWATAWLAEPGTETKTILSNTKSRYNLHVLYNAQSEKTKNTIRF